MWWILKKSFLNGGPRRLYSMGEWHGEKEKIHFDFFEDGKKERKIKRLTLKQKNQSYTCLGTSDRKARKLAKRAGGSGKKLRRDPGIRIRAFQGKVVETNGETAEKREEHLQSSRTSCRVSSKEKKKQKNVGGTSRRPELEESRSRGGKLKERHWKRS